MPVEPLSRRSAVRGLAATGCATAVGFLTAWTGVRRRPGAVSAAANDYGPAATTGRLLARLEDVPAGGGLVLADDKIVLTRDAGDTLRAFSAVCTHQGCPVSGVTAGLIECPCHGSRFDAGTGAVVAGPAPAALPAVPVTVRDGAVYTE